MTDRLTRIEGLIVSLTALAAGAALGFGLSRPLGVVLGGAMALLDFALIRRLGAAALALRPPVARLVPLALTKSLLLVVVPAAALLVPGRFVDGVSFAVGVSALPLAVVVDAMLPSPVGRVV